MLCAAMILGVFTINKLLRTWIPWFVADAAVVYPSSVKVGVGEYTPPLDEGTFSWNFDNFKKISQETF